MLCYHWVGTTQTLLCSLATVSHVYMDACTWHEIRLFVGWRLRHKAVSIIIPWSACCSWIVTLHHQNPTIASPGSHTAYAHPQMTGSKSEWDECVSSQVGTKRACLAHQRSPPRSAPGRYQRCPLAWGWSVWRWQTRLAFPAGCRLESHRTLSQTVCCWLSICMNTNDVQSYHLRLHA